LTNLKFRSGNVLSRINLACLSEILSMFPCQRNEFMEDRIIKELRLNDFESDFNESFKKFLDKNMRINLLFNRKIVDELSDSDEGKEAYTIGKNP
jgi:hypothetical protein